MHDEIHPFTTADLVNCYATGVFPMSDPSKPDEIFLVDPHLRGVLPLDGLHVPRRLARSFLTADVEIAVNRDFRGVLLGCASRPETWISEKIGTVYLQMHKAGFAHSVEIWADGRLAGGLYGVAVGTAFFGESMFSVLRDASKFALIALVARLRAGGFTLLDTQFVTPHLTRLGAIEISRAAYKRRLRAALAARAQFLSLPADTPRQMLLQLSTQTS